MLQSVGNSTLSVSVGGGVECASHWTFRFFLRMQASPPFSDAVDEFRGFLRSQGVCDSIRWIWRDAIISRRCPGTPRSANRRIFIDSARVANSVDIERYYNIGVSRGLGIALLVFCIADGVPYCYVDLPKDETEACNRMISSLKLSIPDPPPTACLIRNSLFAAILRFSIRTPKSASITNMVPRFPDATS